MHGVSFIQLKPLWKWEPLFGFWLGICKIIPSKDGCMSRFSWHEALQACSIYRRQDPRKLRGSFGLSFLGKASLSRGFARGLQGLTRPQNRQNIWVHSITADLVIIPSWFLPASRRIRQISCDFSFWSFGGSGRARKRGWDKPRRPPSNIGDYVLHFIILFYPR